MREASTQPAAVILAAGKGTRMPGDLPKVAHPVGGRPMVCPIVEACIEAGCGRVVVVVGFKQEVVREALAGYRVEFAVQAEQLGTGHAVQCAEAALWAEPAPAQVFVLGGDGPLIRASTLTRLLSRHRSTGAAATLATAVIDDPTGYGRIVRDASGRFERIVEHKNATPEQRAIREVNPSYYCFDRVPLFDALREVRPNEATRERYLTDVLAIMLGKGLRVEVEPGVPPEDVLSINTPAELAVVDRIYRARAGATRTIPHAGLAP